jgi:hypothetical protein
MNDKTRRVFNGWLALTVAERDEFDKALKEYNAASSTKQRELRESSHDRVIKMQTGPLSGGCPCCGR